MFFVSILLTLIVVGALVFLTLLAYLKISRSPKVIGKKGFHFAFIAVLLVFTILVRLGCVATIASQDFSTESFLDGIINSIETIYVTAGGLTFEGQDPSDLMTKIVVIVYYASILWLAATFIFVITLGLSYEISSRVRLAFLRGRADYIYIFTAVTEDALVLADSIENHHGNEKNYLIIFAGNELEPYDKENELHRKIMARGYVYQSYYKAKDKDLEIPLLVKLGIASKKHPFRVLLDKHIKVFALENDAKEYGLESKNSDAVFDDIDEMIRMEFLEKPKADLISEQQIMDFIQNNVDYKNKNADKKFQLQYIDYYILSNSTINYEFYDETILKKLRKVVDNNLLNKQVSIKDGKVLLEEKKKPSPSLYLFIKSIFQIHVINESYLAGEDLINKRREIQIEDIKDDVDAAKNDDKYRYKRFAINRVKVLHEVDEPIKDEERVFNALILGFGQTGQMALNNLYVDSVSLEPMKPEKGANLDKYVPSRFVARVFDLYIGQNIGVFAQTHPSYLIKKYDKDDEFFNLEQLKQFYEKDYPGKFKEIDNLMKFPYIYAYAANCKDLDFLDDIDKATGTLEDDKKKTAGQALGKNNAIVICLGNDEENIKVANAILQNIRQELYNSDFSNTKRLYQTIYVNIRDEKNVGRLNWNDEIELNNHKGIRVRAFGNREVLYSYDSIIEDENFIKANNTYDAVGALVYDAEEKIKKETGNDDYSMPGKERNALVLDPANRQTLLDYVEKANANMDKARLKYLRISDYKKASSKNCALFSAYTSTYINEMGIEELDNYEDKKLWKYLSFLEHQRWCRYNISCGYIYSKTFVGNMDDKDNENYYQIYGALGHNATEYSKSHLKLHVCLLPNSYPGVDYLDDTTECYDYGNVLCASLIAAKQEKKS